MARGIDLEKQRQWRLRVRRFELSGLTAAEFCRAEGVSAPSFYHWRRQLAPARTRRPAESASSRTAPEFVPVRVTPRPAAEVEIHLPNGARVCLPGGDAETLRVAIDSAGRVGRVIAEVSSC